MIYNCVFWLNSFLHRDGVHTTIFPKDDDRTETHFKIEFRTHVQVHEKHNNLMEPRTSGTIALISSIN